MLAEGSDSDATGVLQRVSFTTRSRLKVAPASSERRSEQPAAITTDDVPTTRTRAMSLAMPVDTPVQVALGLSSESSSVPNSPPACAAGTRELGCFDRVARGAWAIPRSSSSDQLTQPRWPLLARGEN